MKKLLLFVLLTLSIKSMAFESEEVLLGYVYDQNGISIQVISGGCTNKNDFVVDKEILNHTYNLKFYRRYPDTCLALFRYGTLIRFSYEELGMELPMPRFRILNEIDADHHRY